MSRLRSPIISTGSTRKTLTDDRGLFVVNLLPPGDYSVLASKPGYASLQLAHVILPTRGRRSVQIMLKPAASPELVEKQTARTQGFDADGSEAFYPDPGFFHTPSPG